MTKFLSFALKRILEAVKLKIIECYHQNIYNKKKTYQICPFFYDIGLNAILVIILRHLLF